MILSFERKVRCGKRFIGIIEEIMLSSFVTDIFVEKIKRNESCILEKLRQNYA